jgi:HlyD family secretion protein
MLRTRAEATGGEQHPDLSAAVSVQIRRQRRLMWIAIGTALLAVAGLVASHWVKSPAEVAAETAPPPPSVITAPVSFGLLRNTVVFRGNFSSGQIVSFTPSGEVAPGGVGAPAQNLVVSGVNTRPGARVYAGDVLMQVSDRPLFILSGAVPAFRDMVQGDTGQDIAELQLGLDEIGYSCAGDRDGVFGAATAAAVRRFYTAIGYAVPLVTGPSATGGGGKGSKSPTELVEVPMSEVMFVPSLPATVSTIAGGLGQQVTPPLVSLALGNPALTGQLDPTDQGVVRPGMRVHVLSNITGKTAWGTVSGVGRLVTPKNGNAPYLRVGIRPSRSWARSWAGQNVQLTITAAATKGPVLAVPEAAITASAGGATYVTVAMAHGGTRRVLVRAGISAAGLVAVTAESGTLSRGDRVVVGS